MRWHWPLLDYVILAQLALQVLTVRDVTNYSLKDLAGIAAVAVALSAAGVALMAWSGFWLSLFGVSIEGPIWCFVGILVALLTTKREHAL